MSDALSWADLKPVHDLVARLQSCSTQPEFSATLVAGAADLVGGDSVGFSKIDQQGRWAGYMQGLEPVPQSEDATLRRLLPSHPLVRHYLHSADDRTRFLSDFWGQQELRDSAFYHDFCRERGIRYQAVSVVNRSSRSLTALVLSRSGPDFGERERAVLDILRPHIAGSAELLAVRLQIRWVLANHESQNDRREHGVVFLDKDGLLEFATDGAVSALERYFPGWHGSRRPEGLADWLAAHSSVSTTVVGEHGALTLTRCADGALSGIALLLREHRNPSRDVVALTEREREVLALLAGGLSNKGIARRLGIAIPTVKTYTGAIYRKLQVQSRTEAIAMAARIGLVNYAVAVRRG